MVDKKFIEWFYQEVYAEPNHNRNGWMRDHADMTNHNCRDWWMREAYKAGYQQRQLDEQQEYESWLEATSEDFDDE
jgi:hypothetical protein